FHAAPRPALRLAEKRPGADLVSQPAARRLDADRPSAHAPEPGDALFFFRLPLLPAAAGTRPLVRPQASPRAAAARDRLSARSRAGHGPVRLHERIGAATCSAR